MKQVTISEFKAKCLALLKHVQQAKKPLLITRFGKPMAEVIPATTHVPSNWLGSMKDQFEIVGDILAPANNPDEWGVSRD